MRGLSVVTVRERGDLLPVVAGWMWRQWWRDMGRTLEETEAIYAECVAGVETAWLFTNTAEEVYLRTGWETVEVVHRPGKRGFAVMRRGIPREG